MDDPAVIHAEESMFVKMNLFENRTIDGHAPYLPNKELSAYKMAGVDTDHEATTFEYALEEVRRGLHVHIREGSAAHNLKDIVEGIVRTGIDTEYFSFCTDDKHIEDILRDGHIDYSVKMAVKLGLDPIRAIKMATINTAKCYGLKHLGAISPGFQADFVVLDNLTDLNERIGPGKIAPPEFSNLGAFSYIDFKASDVYLFAKVIWMILKEEPFGFYGPYKYGEDSKQLLLDEKKYSVETFIPINKLIHEATYDDFTKRINIDDCIGYIELQQKLISNNLNDDEKVIINNLKNEELLIKFKEDKCSKHIISNKEFIAEFLQKNQFPSKIKICGTISDDKEEVKEKELLLEISRVRINHNYCQGYYFINKRKIYECHFIVNEIILNEEKQQFEFQLIEDERLWKYNNIIEARGNIVGKYYVPSNKKIVIDY